MHQIEVFPAFYMDKVLTHSIGRKRTKTLILYNRPHIRLQIRNLWF